MLAIAVAGELACSLKYVSENNGEPNQKSILHFDRAKKLFNLIKNKSEEDFDSIIEEAKNEELYLTLTNEDCIEMLDY